MRKKLQNTLITLFKLNGPHGVHIVPVRRLAEVAWKLEPEHVKADPLVLGFQPNKSHVTLKNAVSLTIVVSSFTRRICVINNRFGSSPG